MSKKFSNLIRRTQPKHQKVSEKQLEDFPEILIVEVYKHLELKDLLICAQVSTKFKAICKDQDVCERININDKNVSREDIQFIFEEKCKNFQLQFATLERDLILTKIFELKCIDSENGEDTEETVVASLEGNNSGWNNSIYHSFLYCLNIKPSAVEKLSSQIGQTLKSLDLSNFRILGFNLDKCEANSEDLEYLISSCHFLEKVSLHSLYLKRNIIETLCLQNCKTLEWMDLCNFRTLDLKSIQHIVTYCIDLTELNIESTSITRAQSIYLVRNLTPKLKKINLGVLSLTDEHIKALVKSCNKLQELKLNNSGPITDDAITSIIGELKNTLVTLDLPSYKEISNIKLLELGEMPKLVNLNIDRPKSEIQRLRIQLPNLFVNEVHPFNM